MTLRQWATTTHGPAELIAASFAFWWGFWIVSPGWTTFGTSPTFRMMALVASEVTWGLLPMVAGVVLGYGSLCGWAVGKQAVLLFLVAYFVFVSVVFGFANIGSTALITYLHIALTYGWLWWTERRRYG